MNSGRQAVKILVQYLFMRVVIVNGMLVYCDGLHEALAKRALPLSRAVYRNVI